MSKWLDRTLVQGPYLRLCLSEKDFNAELKRMKVKPIPFMGTSKALATVHFLDNQDEETCAIVCLKNWEKRTGIQIAGSLTHEAVHIFENHCERIGESHPSSEFMAYGIQNIAVKLMWSFEEQTRGERK